MVSRNSCVTSRVTISAPLALVPSYHARAEKPVKVPISRTCSQRGFNPCSPAATLPQRITHPVLVQSIGPSKSSIDPAAWTTSSPRCCISRRHGNDLLSIPSGRANAVVKLDENDNFALAEWRCWRFRAGHNLRNASHSIPTLSLLDRGRKVARFQA